jgi:hypothetical protein
MKIKTLLCASVVALSALTAKADFQLNFVTANGGSGNPVFDVDGTTKLNNTFFGQIYAGADAGSLAAIGSPVQFGTVGGAPNAGANGFIIGNAVTGTSGTLFGGSAGVYQLRAWTGAATYADASSTIGAKIGSSSVQNVTFGGAPSGGGAPITPPDVSSHNSFALTTVVPEPATIALGLFGAAGLLIRRRK